MGPIETLWLTVILVFIVVAVARGYPSELGVTLIMFAVLLLLVGFSGRLETLLNGLLQRFLNTSLERPGSGAVLSAVYSLLFISMVLANYIGRTFGFAAKPLKGATGVILNVLVGLLNGYLFTGTLWHYQDIYGYPGVVELGLLDPTRFTPFAKAWLSILPPRVFTTEMLAIIVVFLLFLRVRK